MSWAVSNSQVPSVAFTTDSQPDLGGTPVILPTPSLPGPILQAGTGQPLITARSKTSAVEPFPYKREFMNPDELWQNAISLTDIPLKVIRLNNDRVWPSIPKNYRWQFMGYPLAFILPKTGYDQVNRLTDYFSEEVRLRANVYGCVSPLEYYRQNYSEVIDKAKELQEKYHDHPNFRFFIREAVYNLARECNNFKIDLTKYILMFFGSKKVLDPSAGWGDRLLGAAAAGVDSYYGIDPNPALREPYDEMIRFVQARGRGQNFTVLTEDFLKVEMDPESVDTVFTSPPFWNYEIYSSAPGQSIEGKSTVEDWQDNFLFPYLERAWRFLCRGGYMILYISDVRTGRYVGNMARYINQQLKGQFLGIIASASEDLTHGYPLWIWRKV